MLTVIEALGPPSAPSRLDVQVNPDDTSPSSPASVAVPTKVILTPSLNKSPSVGWSIVTTGAAANAVAEASNTENRNS